MFYSGIIVIDYYREYNEIILKKLINTNINMIISMFYEKQDNYKTIKDLTYYIGNDIILFILWGMPVIYGQLILIPMLISPLIYFINDSYGWISWNRRAEK